METLHGEFETRGEVVLVEDGFGNAVVYIKDNYFGGNLYYKGGLPLKVAQRLVERMQSSRDGSKLTINLEYWMVL